MEFSKINHLEEAVTHGVEIIGQEDYKLNFSLKVNFNISLVKEPQIVDCLTLAQEFYQIKKPDHLHINHGEFRGPKGMEHIINELKKHSKNRALFSLISQEHILDTGDNPIPSFMIMQFSLEGTTLYATTYFRALEVSKFFRINMEEIRLYLKDIYDAIKQIEEVNLHVFAFRAYIKSNINTLTKPKIDLYKPSKITSLIFHQPLELSTLLREKLCEDTVVENGAFKTIEDVLQEEEIHLPECLKRGIIKADIRKCIELTEELIKLRSISSHHTDIDNINRQYQQHLSNIIKEIEEQCQ
ncbi:hypothetical protein JCM14036_30770 [Desulfotomaculum defluvii]